jgi:hypothetical protein
MNDVATITDELIDVAARWIADQVRASYAPNGFDESSLNSLYAYRRDYWAKRLRNDREQLTPDMPTLIVEEPGFPRTPRIVVALRPGRVEGWVGSTCEPPVFTWPTDAQ